MDDFFDGISQMSIQFGEAGSGLALKFAGTELMWKVFALAIALELVFIAYRMLTGAASWIQEVVEVCIVAFLISGAVLGWAEVRDGFKSTNEYAAQILPGAERGLTSATTMAVAETIGPLFTKLATLPSLSQLINDKKNEADSTAAKKSAGVVDSAVDAVKETAGMLTTGFFSAITNAAAALADTIIGFLLALVVLFALCILIATVFFVAVLADAMIFTGLCLGPLLLSLAPLKAFRGLAPQFMKFMITSVFYKLVGACFVWMITQSLTLSVSTIAGDAVKTAVLFGVLIQIFIMIAVMKQAPSVASSLVGGFSMGADGGNAVGIAALLRGGKPK